MGRENQTAQESASSLMEGRRASRLRNFWSLACGSCARKLHFDERNKWRRFSVGSKNLSLFRSQGNFRIQARSAHHDLVPHMTNVSHEIHHLSIGDPLGRSMVEKGKAKLPPSAGAKLTPMDGNAYVTHELHEAYHHYLKVITTNVPGLQVGRREIKTYQIIQSSQLSYYRNDQIPEAKFSLDLSPISVSYRKTSRHWYDYLTSLMAIIGGVFTTFGLLESTINAAVRRKRY